MLSFAASEGRHQEKRTTPDQTTSAGIRRKTRRGCCLKAHGAYHLSRGVDACAELSERSHLIPEIDAAISNWVIE